MHLFLSILLTGKIEIVMKGRYLMTSVEGNLGNRMLFQYFSAHLFDSECGNFKMSGSPKLHEVAFWKWFWIMALLFGHRSVR